jgi:hypothetical protein
MTILALYIMPHQCKQNAQLKLVDAQQTIAGHTTMT